MSLFYGKEKNKMLHSTHGLSLFWKVLILEVAPVVPSVLHSPAPLAMTDICEPPRGTDLVNHIVSLGNLKLLGVSEIEDYWTSLC